MSILLATPINKTHYSVPPMGLGYIISALRASGFNEVSLLDAAKENIDYAEFAERITSGKFKILGIQCYSFDVPSVNRMLSLAKKANPDIVTVIGGPHPTAVYGEVFQGFKDLDFAIRGEAEKSFPLLVGAILKGDVNLSGIPGLMYRENGKTKINNPEHIKNIDSLEIPAWDLIDPRTYPDEVQGAFYRGFPVAPIISSRGCPYECTFCANKIMTGRTVRFRKMEKVADEIEYLTHNYGVKEFQIIDDNFMMRKDRVLEFCRIMKEKSLKVYLNFPSGFRLDTIDRDTLAALKEVGAYSVTVGIESASQRILDHMKKGLKIAEIREKVKLIKSMGFSISAFFIIGYPEEKEEDILETIRFARELPIDIAHFSAFLPLPGTDITEELIRTGRLKTINYGDLFYSKTTFSLDGISKDRLKKFQRKAFLDFYFRPRILIGLMLKIRSPRHVKSIVKRARDYVFSKGRQNG